MKIAMISLYLPSASKIGAGYQAHQMANTLVARGHAVTMFSPSPLPDDARYEHVHVRPEGRWRTFRFARDIRRLDFRAFDVIHAHGDDYLLLGRKRPRHIRTMHGSCFAEALRIRGVRERLRMFALGMSELLATIVADETVAVSRNTTRWYPWIRRVIPNGVDLTVFTPAANKATRPTVLFVGTFGNRKRGWLLAEAFKKDVLPQLPLAELQMVAEDVPAAPSVRALGRVSEADLARLYREAWVFCLPSTYEGFGVPYIEAMASGTPVVASSNPGALEVLRDGKYGVIAKDDLLGAELLALLRDPSRRKQLSEMALDWVKQYDWPRVATEYEALYAASGARRLPDTEKAGF